MQILRTALILLAVATAVQAGEWEVRGRVIDESGNPVSGAAVDYFWSANGTGKNEDGTPVDLKQDKEVRTYWSHVGQMEPRHATHATTGADGSFALEIPDIYHAVIAMDRNRGRGGLAVLAKGKEGSPIEIRLGPLVRLQGKSAGQASGKPPFWAHVYLMVPEDAARPLDTYRIAHCGSFDARFELLLPAGTYELDAYAQSKAEADDLDIGLAANLKIELTSDGRNLDLGTLRLPPRPPSVTKRIEQSKAEGAWKNYTEHIGEPAPAWHITDARGVKKNVQISDYRGKWVLLDFWFPRCRPCLKDDLPNLMRFYDEHASQRDQFEIVSICIDIDGEVKTMADLDRVLEPIVKHVWGGKTLPFPTLLDTTFKTYERFGIGEAGSGAVLIDPQGNLVKGDEKALAEKLK